MQRTARLLLALPLLALHACRDHDELPAARPSAPAAPSTTVDPGGALVAVPGDTPVDQQIRDEQEAVRRNPTRARPLLRLAQLFVRKARESSDPGFYQQADDAVTRALRLDPNDLAALQVRGLVLLQDHRFNDVRELAATALARDRQQPIFYGLLGDAEMEVGHYAEAEAAYQRMVDLRPNLASYSRGAWMRWLLGDVEGAVDLARRAVEAGSPRVPEELAWTLVQLGQLELSRGAVDDALADFENALRTYPNYPTALDARGLARRAKGDLQGALQDFTAAAEGATTTEHLIHLGEAQEAAGRTGEAAATFARAERAGRRSDPRALALFYANHDRDHDGAVALARREIESRPDDIYAQDVLAWTLYRAGRLDEAAQLIDRARRLHTREPRFAYHAGMIAHASGQRDAAITLLRQALTWNASFDPRGVDACRRTLAALDATAAPTAPDALAAPRH